MFEVHLQPYQDKFIFSDKRYPAFIGGWATGKTMSGILRAMLYTDHIPNNLGVIFRKEYVDLRDSTIQDFEKYTGHKINSQREVSIDNGSKILFRHLEELNNIQNINLGWYMIEQVDELESDIEFTMLRGRLRRQVVPDDYFLSLNLPFRTGFAIGNVGRPWVKSKWRDKTNKEENEQYEFIEASTFDNIINLPDDYIDDLRTLKREKPEIYNRFVINDWSSDDDSFVLIPASKIEALVNINYFDTELSKVIAIDPSLGGDECAMYALLNNKIIDSRFIHERDTMKLVGEAMLFGAKNKMNNYIIDTIGIGQGIVDRLSELGKNVYPLNSANVSRYPKRFYNIKSEMWWYVMEKILNKEIPCINFDTVLKKQLSAVHYKVVDSNGKIQLEPKQKESFKAVFVNNPRRSCADDLSEPIKFEG